jgi:hypothetical protein
MIRRWQTWPRSARLMRLTAPLWNLSRYRLPRRFGRIRA